MEVSDGAKNQQEKKHKRTFYRWMQGDQIRRRDAGADGKNICWQRMCQQWI